MIETWYEHWSGLIRALLGWGCLNAILIFFLSIVQKQYLHPFQVRPPDNVKMLHGPKHSNLLPNHTTCRINIREQYQTPRSWQGWWCLQNVYLVLLSSTPKVRSMLWPLHYTYVDKRSVECNCLAVFYFNTLTNYRINSWFKIKAIFFSYQ